MDEETLDLFLEFVATLGPRPGGLDELLTGWLGWAEENCPWRRFEVAQAVEAILERAARRRGAP